MYIWIDKLIGKLHPWYKKMNLFSLCWKIWIVYWFQPYAEWTCRAYFRNSIQPAYTWMSLSPCWNCWWWNHTWWSLGKYIQYILREKVWWNFHQRRNSVMTRFWCPTSIIVTFTKISCHFYCSCTKYMIYNAFHTTKQLSSHYSNRKQKLNALKWPCERKYTIWKYRSWTV